MPAADGDAHKSIELQYACEMSMSLCPAVHIPTRNYLRFWPDAQYIDSILLSRK